MDFDILMCLALTRQKYWKIRTDFTTLLLHNYRLKSDCEDYKKARQVENSYLFSLVVFIV
jgi:hypothetical protein